MNGSRIRCRPIVALEDFNFIAILPLQAAQRYSVGLAGAASRTHVENSKKFSTASDNSKIERACDSATTVGVKVVQTTIERSLYSTVPSIEHLEFITQRLERVCSFVEIRNRCDELK